MQPNEINKQNTKTNINPRKRTICRERWASPNKYRFTNNRIIATISKAIAIDTYLEFTNTKHEEMKTYASEIENKEWSQTSKEQSQVSKERSDISQKWSQTSQKWSEISKKWSETSQKQSETSQKRSEISKKQSEYTKFVSQHNDDKEQFINILKYSIIINKTLESILISFECFISLK